MNIAFTFPGQGSQYVGMGKELYDEFLIVRNVFEEASDVLKYDVRKMCFEGPESELTITSNTQPAILTVSVACLRVLQEQGIKPAAVAGHSLGEYSALVAAKALSFADAVMIVRKRGQFMQECAPDKGGMAAVLGLERELVVKACEEAADEGIVMVANYNCPGQIVISGEAAALQKAMRLSSEYGARRVVPLQVSGPFHSLLMTKAGEMLSEALENLKINQPVYPVVANVTGQVIESASEIKELLVEQVSSSVLWEDSVKKMHSMGINTFVELGPGKVLCGLGKKIAKEAVFLNVENNASLENSLDNLKEVL